MPTSPVAALGLPRHPDTEHLYQLRQEAGCAQVGFREYLAAQAVLRGMQSVRAAARRSIDRKERRGLWQDRGK